MAQVSELLGSVLAPAGGKVAISTSGAMAMKAVCLAGVILEVADACGAGQGGNPCAACEANHVSADQNDKCTKCAEGTVPNSDNSACEACKKTKFIESHKCKDKDDCKDPKKFTEGEEDDKPGKCENAAPVVQATVAAFLAAVSAFAQS